MTPVYLIGRSLRTVLMVKVSQEWTVIRPITISSDAVPFCSLLISVLQKSRRGPMAPFAVEFEVLISAAMAAFCV
jgi:hypothetical protein